MIMLNTDIYMYIFILVLSIVAEHRNSIVYTTLE